MELTGWQIDRAAGNQSMVSFVTRSDPKINLIPK
jgi:hypothetical protein